MQAQAVQSKQSKLSRHVFDASLFQICLKKEDFTSNKSIVYLHGDLDFMRVCICIILPVVKVNELLVAKVL